MNNLKELIRQDYEAGHYMPNEGGWFASEYESCLKLLDDAAWYASKPDEENQNLFKKVFPKTFEAVGLICKIKSEYRLIGNETIYETYTFYIPGQNLYFAFDLHCTSQGDCFWEYLTVNDLYEVVPKEVTMTIYERK